MKAVILAGGFGTRLRERVPDLPKPMAPVAGRPFIAHLLDRLARTPIDSVVLSTGYRAEAIRRFVGDTWNGLAVEYAEEPEPLGTGGALAYACREHREQPWLVLNGDTFVDLDYRALFDWYRQVPEDLAMVIRPVPDTARYGALTVEGDRVVGFIDKGHPGLGLINAGVYFLRPTLFERYGLSGAFSFETDLLVRHIGLQPPRAFPFAGRFIDIGVPEDFERAQTLLAATGAAPTPTPTPDQPITR